MSLLESLEPFRKATYVFGTLPDWCYSSTKTRTQVVLNSVGILFQILLLFSLVSYLFLQSYNALIESTSIHVFIPVFVWLLCFSMMLFNQIYFLYKHKLMIDLFSNWNSLDKTFTAFTNQDLVDEEKKVRKIFVSMLVIFCSCSVGLVTIIPYMSAQRTSYIYHAVIRQIFTDPPLLFVQSVTFVNATLVVFMGHVIPAIIYFHAAVINRTLDEQIKKSFDHSFGFGSQIGYFRRHSLSEERPLSIMANYQKASQLVLRTNHIFGLPALFCHSTLLTWLIFLFYTLLKNSNKNSLIENLIILGNLPTVAIVLITPLLVSAHYQISLEHLKLTVNRILCEDMTIQWKREYYCLRTIMFRTSANNVLGSALNFYNINRSLLLKMFVIFVSYNVILYQS